MTTYSSLYFHLVWSTKNREQHIHEIFEPDLYKYITVILKNKGIDLIQIGGMPDHLHLLIRMNPDHLLPHIIRDVKINSTKMIRSNLQTAKNFHWQEGYGAFSVSKSNTDAVKQYIIDQKKHHQMKSFDAEWTILLQRHEIIYDEKYYLG